MPTGMLNVSGSPLAVFSADIAQLNPSHVCTTQRFSRGTQGQTLCAEAVVSSRSSESGRRSLSDFIRAFILSKKSADECAPGGAEYPDVKRRAASRHSPLREVVHEAQRIRFPIRVVLGATICCAAGAT